MRTLFFLIIFSFPFGKFHAQDPVSRFWGLQSGYYHSDIFLGISAGKKHNRLEQRVSGEIGVIKTVFQLRIFPQASYQLSYHILNREKICAGLFVKPAVNMIHFNRAAKNGYAFSEALYAGPHVGFGKINHFRASAGYGLVMEQTFDQLKSAYSSWNSIQLMVELSWTHAL